MAGSWNPLAWMQAKLGGLDEKSRANIARMTEKAQAAGVKRNLGVAMAADPGDPGARETRRLESLLNDTSLARTGEAMSADAFKAHLAGLSGRPTDGSKLPTRKAEKQAAMDANRQGYANQLALDMIRGQARRFIPGTMGDKGNLEMALNFLAQKEGAGMMTRRGLTGAAALGGGVGMTAGAQQLLALMQFMNQGEETAQRNEASPLKQA